MLHRDELIQQICRWNGVNTRLARTGIGEQIVLSKTRAAPEPPLCSPNFPVRATGRFVVPPVLRYSPAADRGRRRRPCGNELTLLVPVRATAVQQGVPKSGYPSASVWLRSGAEGSGCERPAPGNPHVGSGLLDQALERSPPACKQRRRMSAAASENRRQCQGGSPMPVTVFILGRKLGGVKALVRTRSFFRFS